MLENNLSFAKRVMLASVFFIYCHITLATTNNDSRTIFESLRILSALFMVIFAVVYIKRSRVLIAQYTLQISVLLLSIHGYAYFLAVAVFQTESRLDVTILLAIALGYLFLKLTFDYRNTSSYALGLVVCGIIGFAVNVVVGGVAMQNGFIGFNLEYLSQNSDVYYSQGLSKFFAVSTIGAAVLSQQVTQMAVKISVFFIMAGFFILNIISAARGETLFLVLILAYMLLRERQLFAFIVIAAFFAVAMYFLSDKLYLVDRFYQLSLGIGSSERIAYLSDAANLISDNPFCLLLGCGYGYFQYWHGYSIGQYPHNIFAELTISFGLVVMVLVVLATVRGLSGHNKSVGGLDVISLVFTYYLMVLLKSGSFIYSIFFMILCVFFMTRSYTATVICSRA